MPYCPKCDMEFVEGVTVCTDCGGPLYESEEAAMAARKEAEEKALEKARQDLMEALILEGEDLDGPEGGTEGEEDPLKALARRTRKEIPQTGVYVKKSARFQDMKSSAQAFFLLGGAALAAALLCFLKIIPLAGSAWPIITAAAALFGAACLAVGVKTLKEAASLKTEAARENKETDALVSWFLTTYSAEEIDRQLQSDAEAAKDSLDTYSPEELSLKRYGLIQDLLITQKDLPDQSYVDLLCEEIYNRMFGQE